MLLLESPVSSVNKQRFLAFRSYFNCSSLVHLCPLQHSRKTQNPTVFTAGEQHSLSWLVVCNKVRGSCYQFPLSKTHLEHWSEQLQHSIPCNTHLLERHRRAQHPHCTFRSEMVAITPHPMSQNHWGNLDIQWHKWSPALLAVWSQCSHQGGDRNKRLSTPFREGI